MRKKIFNNWGLKVASLFLAAVLWFLVVQIQDPKDSKTFTNVPVRITGEELLENQNKVYEVLDNTDVVTVTVRAPKSIISQLRSSDIIAEADMSKLTDINTLGITYSIQNVDVEYTINGNHDVVRLNIEDKSSKWIKVTYDTIGEVAQDYIISSITPDQTHIEVSGPKSTIDRISCAYVEVDVSDANSNLTTNPDITLIDKDGNNIEQKNVIKNVDSVHMSVEILATKSVPIEVNFMGVPEDGYMATGVVTCEPSTVMIAGTPNALASVSQITIPEDRLNITGENSDMSDVVNLKEYLPDNIKLADSSFNGRVTATVYIEPIVSRDLEVPVRNISIVNIPEGVTIALDDSVEIVNLTVKGLEAKVSSLNPTFLHGRVDIQKWMEDENIDSIKGGNYVLPVIWNLDDEIMVDGEIKVGIDVTVD